MDAVPIWILGFGPKYVSPTAFVSFNCAYFFELQSSVLIFRYFYRSAEFRPTCTEVSMIAELVMQ